MILQKERKISISVISSNRKMIEKIELIIRESYDFVKISSCNSESSFIETASYEEPYLIVSDRTADSSGWNTFYSKVQQHMPEARLVIIISQEENDLATEMINAGIYDVITPASLSKIRPVVQRVIGDSEVYSSLRTLEKEKNLNDHIVNCSRSMLSIINRDYIYEKVNTTFCNAHNINLGNIIGKSLAEVWGPDTFRSKIKENIDICFKGNTVRYEANFNTPLFGDRYYEVVFRPITEGDGKINHLLAETFDISSLKLSQKVVNEMEEEFKKLETSLPIGFLRCEPDGTIIHANKAFMKIIECEDEARLSGLSINEFYTEKGLFAIHLHQLRTEQNKTFGRVPLYTFSGNEIECRISGFVVADKSGSQSFIDFAFEDSSRELMLENRLLQAQKLETIGALAGGLAHDFNNILATILGYSELLLDEVPGNPEMSEKIIKIISAISRAKALTNQILTFSRQVEQEKIPVNVFDVLKETIGFIESAKPENVKVDGSIQDPDVMVHADPTQLFRVFLNLMTNSIQAMEGRGGTLTINLTLTEGNLIRHELNRNIVADEYALVTFEDTGIGMEPSVMARIFEPYFTTKEIGKGTGLGLSVVHAIVAEIDGEIIVKSRKDKGSVFYLYLPVYRDYPEPDTIKPEKHLLIITGNPHESRILSLALEKSGYIPQFAADLEKLRKTLSENSMLPDAIIYMDDSADVKTEDIEFIYSECRINTPLILITDTYQYSSKENLLNSGIARQVLIKPVSLREIHTAIQISLT